ncbi:MAG: zinc ribbon domain-containing protein [Planctomycetota bacterium]|nr:zinc ribbon domain-containing protein [Planctomycetota bacterium]
MYCSECGSPVRGKFCSHCGTKLDGGGVATIDEPILAEAIVDLETEVQYDVLMQLPEFRSKIERHAKMAKKVISGEEFLRFFDKVYPTGIPLDKVAAFVQPLYASWGISLEKTQSQVLRMPVARAMLRVLCSMARNNQVLRDAQQATDGCMFRATLQSTLLSLEGEVIVVVRRAPAGTEVQAAIKIPGAWYDWGKSKRALELLFADLQTDPA